MAQQFNIIGMFWHVMVSVTDDYANCSKLFTLV